MRTFLTFISIIFFTFTGSAFAQDNVVCAADSRPVINEQGDIATTYCDPVIRVAPQPQYVRPVPQTNERPTSREILMQMEPSRIQEPTHAYRALIENHQSEMDIFRIQAKWCFAGHEGMCNLIDATDGPVLGGTSGGMSDHIGHNVLIVPSDYSNGNDSLSPIGSGVTILFEALSLGLATLAGLLLLAKLIESRIKKAREKMIGFD